MGIFPRFFINPHSGFLKASHRQRGSWFEYSCWELRSKNWRTSQCDFGPLRLRLQVSLCAASAESYPPPISCYQTWKQTKVHAFSTSLLQLRSEALWGPVQKFLWRLSNETHWHHRDASKVLFFLLTKKGVRHLSSTHHNLYSSQPKSWSGVAFPRE